LPLSTFSLFTMREVFTLSSHIQRHVGKKLDTWRWFIRLRGRSSWPMKLSHSTGGHWWVRVDGDKEITIGSNFRRNPRGERGKQFFCFGQFSRDVPKWQWATRSLAKFGYRIKFESRILRTSFNIFGYVLEPCIEIWENFLKFGRFMASEKSKKALDFSTFNFQYSFLAVYI